MTREMHRGKMQVILRDWDPSKVPDGDEPQEDEAELNVMDFVETEYKFESSDEAKANKRKFSEEKKSKSKKCWRLSVQKVGNSPRETKIKVNKKLRTNKLPTPRISYIDSNFSVLYPYAACLKSLCDKIGTCQDPSSESLPVKLFDQLHHLEVHYPYAALLKELYLTAQADSNTVPSKRSDLNCQDQGTAELMKSLNYQIEIKSKKCKQRHNSPDFETPYSTILGILIRHQKCESKENTKDSVSCGMNGIGKILCNSMEEEHIEDLPLSELHSSALLHKISLSVQKNQGPQARGNYLHGPKNPELSSTESSQSELDDLDWKPSRARKKANGLPNTKKRKSERRKTQSQPGSSVLLNTLQGPESTSMRENYQEEPEPLAPSRLLQLILGKNQNKQASSFGTLSPKKIRLKTGENKFIMKNNNKTESKGYSKNTGKKNKHVIKSEMGNSNEARGDGKEKGLFIDENQSKKRYLDDSQNSLDPNTSEQQSLLKEYLLKPAGEETKTEENCDMPKVETHFLFSRMLQNFKILAEASSSESITERDQEAQSVPDILRGMLVSGNTEGELQASVEADKDNKSLIQSALKQANLFDEEDQVGKVECDKNSVICKVEYNEDLCKVEQEDDFECQVCHLQFSSGMDLSNHQVLFHCAEDPQASSSCVVLSLDNLQNSVLQEKQPA